MTTIPIYLLFAGISMWHLKIAHYSNLQELCLAPILILAPYTHLRRKHKIHTLDLIVLLYVCTELYSVAVGSDALYASMRIFRYHAVTPVLIYFVVRFSAVDMATLIKGLQFMCFGILVQALIVIMFYMQFHTRPVGILWHNYQLSYLVSGPVSISLYCCVALGIMLFSMRKVRGSIHRKFRYLAIALLTLGLMGTLTRMPTAAFLLFAPTMGYICRSQLRRKALAYSLYWGTVALLFMIVFANDLFDYKSWYWSAGDVGRTYSRVLNIELYFEDLMSRFFIWGRVFDNVLENSPIIGFGESSYEIGRVSTVVSVGSAHNVLVSSFQTSGLIGLGVMMALLFSTINTALSLSPTTEDADIVRRIAILSFIVLFVSILTNDISGGRANLLFLLIAIIVKVAVEKQPAVMTQNLKYAPA